MEDGARVSLQELGVWGRLVRVELGGRWEEVWIQTLGDRSEALERGHEAMQRKLLEFRPGSERDQALREALALLPSEDLVELALEGERARLAARVSRELPDPVRPRRDREAGESEEAYLARLARHRQECEQREQERAARLQELLAARRRELEQKERSELVELARPRRVDVECWNAFARACDDWVLLRAVRRADDHSQQYFQDIGQVQALHPAVREQLRAAYRELDPPERAELPKSSANTRGSG